MAQGRGAVARGYTLQFTTAMEEWDEVYSFGEGCTYGDQVVATAILERLLHHSCRDPGCGVCVSWGFSWPSLADRKLSYGLDQFLGSTSCPPLWRPSSAVPTTVRPRP
jgi:hypothetical protein